MSPHTLHIHTPNRSELISNFADVASRAVTKIEIDTSQLQLSSYPQQLQRQIKRAIDKKASSCNFVRKSWKQSSVKSPQGHFVSHQHRAAASVTPQKTRTPVIPTVVQTFPDSPSPKLV
jgi:hypothetical protein